MTAQPSSPAPDESPATGPEIARFGVGDHPFGATDHGFATDTLLPAPSADGEVR
jgi:hypothetical protein